MNEHAPEIERFLHAVRSQLQRSLWWRSIAWSLLLASAITAVVALGIVATGRSVPSWIYLMAGGGMLLGAIVSWLALRPDLLETAAAADRAFSLRDALHSFLTFRAQGRSGGLYDLQAERTAINLASCKPAAIASNSSPRIWGLAFACLAAALCLGFVDESKQRKEERLVAETTQRKTEEIKDALLELVREVEAELEALDPMESDDGIKEMVEALSATAEPEEAMRQYARLERELRERIARMTPRQEQQLLDRAAKELERSPEAAELSAKLKRREYEAAAQDIDELKLTEAKDPSKQLSEQRKQLARLKAIAQRMAQAAKASRSDKQQASAGDQQAGPQGEAQASGSRSSSTAKSSKSSKSSTSTAKAGAKAGQASESQELDQLLEEFERDAQDMDAQLAEAQRQVDRLQKMDPQQMQRCENAGKKLSETTDKLSDRLSKIGDRQKASDKLSQMRQQLGACQSYLAGKQSGSLAAMMQAKSPGGRNPGSGAGDNPAAEQDPDFQGGVDRLTGRKGSGPSQISVEDAESGTAVSGRTATARQRSFDRQLESFVAREDVPEDLKHGVKAYFETVHDTAPSP